MTGGRDGAGRGLVPGRLLRGIPGDCVIFSEISEISEMRRDDCVARAGRAGSGALRVRPLVSVSWLEIASIQILKPHRFGSRSRVDSEAFRVALPAGGRACLASLSLSLLPSLSLILSSFFSHSFLHPPPLPPRPLRRPLFSACLTVCPSQATHLPHPSHPTPPHPTGPTLPVHSSPMSSTGAAARRRPFALNSRAKGAGVKPLGRKPVVMKRLKSFS